MPIIRSRSATQLYALAVPSRGGDSLFANGYAAYDALPEQLKRRLDGVIAAFSYGGRRGGSALLDKADQDFKPVLHPIIRTHPETGRKSLYFDPGKIVDIVGADRARATRYRRAQRLHDPARRQYRHQMRRATS